MHLFKHPLGEKAFEHVKWAIQKPPLGHIVSIVGCGGVGKSTALYRVLQELFGHPSHWQDNVTPVARVYALLPHQAFFCSLEFASSIRREVMFPDPAWLRKNPSAELDDWVVTKRSEIFAASQLVPLDRRQPERVEWQNLSDLVRSYKTQILVVEHATALLRNHRDKKAAQHLQNLMSWSEKAGVRVVLVGTESLPELWIDSNELSRRVVKVWIPPYPGETLDDLKNFASVVNQMLGDYEADIKKILTKCRFVHISTAGIPGQMRRLFDDASRHGGGRITLKNLSDSVLSQQEIAFMWKSVAIFNAACRAPTNQELIMAKSVGSRASDK